MCTLRARGEDLPGGPAKELRSLSAPPISVTSSLGEPSIFNFRLSYP